VGQNLLYRLHVEYGVLGPTNPEIKHEVYAKAAYVSRECLPTNTTSVL